MKRITSELLKVAGRFYPFLSGRGNLTGRPLYQWAASGCKEREWATLLNGRKLLVDPREDLGRSVLYTRDWDQKVTKICQTLLRKGDTFIDIGGHCGLVSMQACDMVGATGQIHVFEPQPSMYGLMAESIKKNGVSHIHLHPVALSDHSGVVQMPVPYGKPTNASFSRRAEDAEYTVEVKMEEADTYLLNLGLSQVRLIKIDVEGHEEVLLNSMRKFFAQVKVDALLIESEPHEGPFSERPAPAILRSLGYSFLAIPRRYMKLEFMRVTKDNEQSLFRDAHDFLALSPELIASGNSPW